MLSLMAGKVNNDLGRKRGLHSPFAGSCLTAMLAIGLFGSGWVQAQSPSKEYIYLGGRVIATESPAVAVVINGVQAIPTTTGATIQWNTTIASDSQVLYGTTSSYGGQTTVDATLVVSHSQTLTGLIPNTLYHYKVRSKTATAAAVESADLTFTTTNVVISAVQAAPTPTSATIQWTTSDASDSQVFYGTTSSYGSQTTVDASLVVPHSQTLTSLIPNTLYHYKVRSKPPTGTAVESADFTFTTTDQVAISTVSATVASANSVIIQWITNIPSDSKVFYGSTVSYGNETTLVSNMVTTHVQTLSGLTPDTTYYYKVRSNPATGTGAEGASTFKIIPCALSSNAGSASGLGDSGTVDITSCAATQAWTAVSNSAWLKVSPASGNGPASLRWEATANSGDARSGTLTIAGKTFTVNQAAQVVSAPVRVATDSGLTGVYLTVGSSVQFNAYLNGSSTPSNASVTWEITPSIPVFVVPDTNNPGRFVYQNLAPSPYNSQITITARSGSNAATASILLSLTPTPDIALPMVPASSARVMILGWFRPTTGGSEYNVSQYIFFGLDPSSIATGCELQHTPYESLILTGPGGNLVSSNLPQHFAGFVRTAPSQPSLTNDRCRVVLDTNEAYVEYDSSSSAWAHNRFLVFPIEAQPGFTGTKGVFRKATAESAYQNVGAWTIPVVASPPTFSPNPTTYSGPQTIRMSTTTSGATIRYTIDGSTPTPDTGDVYSSATPISITKNTTFKAIACGANFTTSGVSTAVYKIQAGLPAFSPTPGTYRAPQEVTMSTSPAEAAIHYTIDGISTPTPTSGILYSNTPPISITATTTFKAIAHGTGVENSGVSSATYTMLPPLNLVITSIPIGNTLFQAVYSITAGVGVTVDSAAQATFASRNSISLQPGFHATAGGTGTTFRAFIDPQIP